MKRFLSFFALISVILTIASCSKDNDNDINLKSSIGDYDEYFIAMANGNELKLGFSYPADDTADFGGVISYSGITCDHDLGVGIYPYNDESLPYAGIDVIGYFDNLCGGREENLVFNSLFPTGIYNVSNGNTKGIYISLDYNVGTNEYYSTEGIQQPANSYLRITSSEESNIEIVPGFYNFGQLLEGEFMVNMVNSRDDSDIINVEGIFRLRLESYSQSRLD